MIDFDYIKGETKITIYSKKYISVSNLINDFKLDYKKVHHVKISLDTETKVHTIVFYYTIDRLDELQKAILITTVNEFIKKPED